MTATLTDTTPLTEAQFKAISALVKSICGIDLHDGKRELVKARLAKRIRLLGLTTFDEYIQVIRDDSSGNELTSMLDSLSTNLTFFFRETAHFEYLRTVAIPRLIEHRRPQGKLRLWSAGCSTGEEPYSLAMLLAEHFPELRSWDVRILATDLSTRVLAQAREGMYDASRVGQVPAALAQKYFTPNDDDGQTFRVCDEVRSKVTFARLNLMERWPMKGPFDFIFCRNVMIYFDKPTQETLVRNFYDLLAPGCLLMIGHSESLTGIAQAFQYVRPAVYQK
ncbi:MAG: protein-glutamate O-methyltransferase CheR [Phycisphaerae bacterium]|nr:protein-glutamate O-methyltransferase CheR [Phycisphaerae bacterium]